MSELKATPGPWSVHAFDTVYWIKSADGIKVVSTSWHSHIRKPYPLKREALANARLIAAAPALYEALTQLLASEDFADDRSHWETEMAEGNGHAPQVLAAMDALKLAR